MPFITQTLLNDNRLQLGREEFVRPHAFGGQWTKLRIGLHWAMYAPPGINQGFDGISNFLSGRLGFFYVGLCQGSGGGYSNPSPTDVLVANPFTQGGVRSPWTFNFTSPFNYYRVFLNPATFIWRRGTTESTTTAGSSGTYGSCTPCRQQLFLDITILNYNLIRFDMYGPGSPTQGVTDINRFTFLQAMEMDDPRPNGTSQFVSNAQLTYTGNFNLDSVCIYWERSVPTFEFSEIAVTRLF